MAATIPDLTRKIDTIFTTTWYEMQKKAIDNILDANVISAALREAGCFKTQVGGKYIERTVRYGKKTATAVAKGDTLPTGEDEIETAAFWDWKYLTVHCQRSLQDDQQNSGQGAIKSLVQTKLSAARDALDEKFESALLAPINTALSRADCRAPRDPYSLFNLFDPTGTSATYHPTTIGSPAYSYGGLSTAGDPSAKTLNYWWQPKYTSATAPALMNLLDQMRTTYNNCAAGGNDVPDLILMDQNLFEAYEDVCGASIQLVADVGSKLAQLGYDSLKFKGAKVVWTPNALFTNGSYTRMAMFLNTKWIDVVYDPNLWFTMTSWMTLPNQLERLARIVCAFPGIICYQPRRQGLLSAYTS